MVITGIGAMGGNRPVDQLRTDGTGPKPAPRTIASEEVGAPVSSAREMAAAGAPIEADKVARIKAGIADGSYRVNAQAIAEKMIALDLPAKA